MSTQTFNILTWNIDGITNKLNDKDFINYLLSFDIFCVLETWLQTLSDDISSMFSGHICIFVPAKKLSRFGRAMGGIILFINKTYEKYIRNIEISCEFGIFLKVKKEFLQLDKDLILSCMYLPPQGSPFYDELQINGMDLFEDVFVTLFSQFSDCYFLTMGDLNCRTGNIRDFEIF